MPYSHHSHSGQFCPGHARNTLEEMIRVAIGKKMEIFCLTEHMPRHEQDRYPEEIETEATTESMFANQAAFVTEALRLRDKYKGQINLPLGFESDYCRPEAGDLIRRLIGEHPFDFFMGSIHHVRAIPIDYDRAMYEQARSVCGGHDEDIYAAYFDEQYAMLQDLKPLVVGHFDLIRLKSDDPDGSFPKLSHVWSLMMRNLDFIVSYGGMLEINSAALRKGMREPYPSLDVCTEFRQKGGRFCLSDDSHGVDQVAYGYTALLPFLKAANISEISYLAHVATPSKVIDDRFPHTEIRTLSVLEMEQLAFWQAVKDASGLPQKA